MSETMKERREKIEKVLKEDFATTAVSLAALSHLIGTLMEKALEQGTVSLAETHGYAVDGVEDATGEKLSANHCAISLILAMRHTLRKLVAKEIGDAGAHLARMFKLTATMALMEEALEDGVALDDIAAAMDLGETQVKPVLELLAGELAKAANEQFERVDGIVAEDVDRAGDAVGNKVELTKLSAVTVGHIQRLVREAMASEDGAVVVPGSTAEN